MMKLYQLIGHNCSRLLWLLDYKAFSKKLYIYLKEKFWFAVNYNNVEEEDEQESDGLPQDSQYQETILGLRNSLADVFISLTSRDTYIH